MQISAKFAWIRAKIVQINADECQVHGKIMQIGAEGPSPWRNSAAPAAPSPPEPYGEPCGWIRLPQPSHALVSSNLQVQPKVQNRG